MPRGGRRGRFWPRCHREEDHGPGVPPPPPPPNIDHLRWISPIRRGSRNLRPSHWLLDGSGACSDAASPHSAPRWVGGGHQHEGDYYYDEEDEQRESHHSAGPEICFICGDLVGNHPDLPSVHLCDVGEYAYVGTSSMNRTGGGRYGRRNRRDHDPPGGCRYQEVGAGFNKNTARGTDKLPRDEATLDWLIERLHNSQITMNRNVKDLCCKLKNTGGQANSANDNEEEEEAFTETLVTELQVGLQDQYSNFLDQVRLQIMDKCVSLESENKRIKHVQQTLAARKTEIDERQKNLDTQEKEVSEMRHKVECERAKLVKDSDKEKVEIRRQWQKLKDEVSHMEEMHKVQANRVKLDVGGVTFTTSTSTLIRDQDSMLAAMFSGRHELKYEDDGTIFIDRDGTHFRYILNFLRDGTTEGSLPDSQQALKELLNEAVYFQIAGLIESIEERLQ